MTTGSRITAADLVPLQERLRYLRLFRLCAAALVLASWPLLSEARQVGLPELALGTAVFVAVALAIEALWLRRRRRGRHIQTVMLLLDGLYLAAVAYLMGGVGSPLRTLIAVHVVAVSLLASFRTGAKLALWHSVLLYLTFYGQEAGLLDTFGAAAAELGGEQFRLLLVWIGVFWLAALATAAFAAVNERELRRQRFDLQALARFAYRLEEETTATAVGATLAAAVAEDLGFERTVLLGHRESRLLMLAGVGVEQALPLEAPAEGSPLLEAMNRREALLVSAGEASKDASISKLMPRPGNLILLPMQAEGRTVAVLIAEHALQRGSRVERWTLSMLERFGSHAALALANGWLLEDLEQSARTDGLTGLANRASFEEALRQELAGAERADRPVSLVLLDIDHFKVLNDTSGHQAGDAALQRVADVLRRHAPVSHTAARYGGEEFALVLPNVGEDGAMELAERLRQEVALLPGEVPMTASFGVATYPQDAVDLESLVRATDGALYASKRAGRNRTTPASALAPRAGKAPIEDGDGGDPSRDRLHDSLTGLASRPLFLDHLAVALARARRQGSTVAVLVLDLARIKLVNDSLGHDAGDQLLVAASRRLDQIARAGDIVARVGGDDFAVLFEVADEEEASTVAERLLDTLQAPLVLGGERIAMSASVGVAVAGGGAARPQELLTDADAAMHRAKQLGGSRVELFDETLRERLRARIDDEKALRKALERDEFAVVYQPLVDLRELRVTGFEALVRWHHPSRGVVSPVDFISLAEETGLIVPIGAHVLREACRQGARWRVAYPHLDLTMAVNLSACQLADPELLTTLRTALRENQLDPRALILEITESTAMESLEAAAGRLKAMRAEGVRAAIDDFGTGYSSLGSLRRLAIDTVKVDRSFVAGVDSQTEDRAIVDAIRAMAEALGLSLVAEGIESAGQLEALVELGFDTGQGMFFAPPLTAAAAGAALRRGGSFAAAANAA